MIHSYHILRRAYASNPLVPHADIVAAIWICEGQEIITAGYMTVKQPAHSNSGCML